jgi:hypothetical protein
VVELKHIAACMVMHASAVACCNSKFFEQTASTAEKLYYNELFDAKSNSVKQLWHSLNEIASFKGRKSFSSIISELTNSKNEIVPDS